MDDIIWAAVGLLDTIEEPNQDVYNAMNLLMRSAGPGSRPTGVKVMWYSTSDLDVELKKRLIRHVIAVRRPKTTTKTRARKILAHKGLRVGFVDPSIYGGYGADGVILALPTKSYKKLILE